jgi:hypothetical protein
MIDYSQLLYYLILAYRSLGYSAAESQEQALSLVLAAKSNLIEYESIWRRLFNRVQGV